jgi:PAS domain S-box-containing protein
MKISSRSRSSLRVAALYLLFGIAWIVLSDVIVEQLVPAAGRGVVQTFKGSVFVALSALVIWALVRAEQRSRRWTESVLASLCELLPDGFVLRRRRDDVLTTVNRGFAELVGRSVEELEGSSVDDLGLQFDPGEWERLHRRLERDGVVRNHLLHVTRRGDGRSGVHLASARNIELRGEGYVLTVAKDVTELVMARRRLEVQLERLRALREIDLAIAGSHDRRVATGVILDCVVRSLEVDGAALLLHRKGSGTLEVTGSRGFASDALDFTTRESGSGLAGRAASSGETVRIDDLTEMLPEPFAERLVEDEGFRAYAGVPLEAKGEVKGVLEVFNRDPLPDDRGWSEFLEVLAGQAAIALDNAGLIEDLRNSNRKLRRAYDRTIEGWARALDLRDRETHGHTRRVTEITIRLARRLGIEEEALVHVRRGALLHDIGKMGIPDTILQKPGPLDEEEWKVMRRHPEMAYRLLAPIEFLEPALHIPYCHHEKWDGTGYPRRLQGAEIPLAARIFAVVDVWDALLSDRPYRDAWPEDEALQHIREESGSHFDPRVVEAFLDLRQEEDLRTLVRGGQQEELPPPRPEDLPVP